MPKLLLTAIFACFCLSVISQQLTQSIRGRVVDSDAKVSLPGVTVLLVDSSDTPNGVSSDENGYYHLQNVPVGKVTLRFSFIGYKPSFVERVTLTSGKELIININLEESTMMMKEVVVSASAGRRLEDPVNEMALVSAKAFTVEETEKYAGSRGDPARMVSNFAGVAGSDDSRNDIVVRGNSPLGISYRVEGVNIYNPNHFSVAGSGGGPLSIINNKTLGNSDFFTGAFPAEYGNSLSAVFDLKFRNGNTEQHEFIGQFGFLGTELTAEGPISKENRSSYIINYRYSTLSLFKFMGIQIGTKATPKYQDGSFKLNFPTKNGGNWAVFGMGGISAIDIMISDQVEPTAELYGQQDRDQHFRTSMGFVGASYSKSIGQKTFAKITVAQSAENMNSHHDLVYRHVDANDMYVVDTLLPILYYYFTQSKLSVNAFVNHKFNAGNVVKFGIYSDRMNLNFRDSAFFTGPYKWVNRWEYTNTTSLYQPFVQWKYKPSDKVTVTSGLHAQYFALNESLSLVEPRVAFKWDMTQKQTITGGYGKHSQLQPMYTYFYHLYDDEGNQVYHNQNMGFSMSDHFVLSHSIRFGSKAYIKTEVYYQNLYNIPVEVNSSSFSLVNQGSGFQRFYPDSLENTGTGRNMGTEVTFVKYFPKEFFMMTTLTLYDSKYKGSDGVARNTDFNGRYIVNLLMSKDFKVREDNTFTLGTKLTVAGNKWYSPLDLEASEAVGEIVYLDEQRNTVQFRDYLRWDLKINYRINRPKVTHEIAFDIVNVTSRKNVLKLSYVPNEADPTQSPIREEYQLARLPLFYYKLEF